MTKPHASCITYGYIGGETNKEAANRTNDIIKIILEDAKQHPRGTMMIVGNLNSSTCKIASLDIESKESRLIDMGAQAEHFGNQNEDFTCRAHGAKNLTRRDYVFANPEAFELIEDFKVDHGAGFDVHDALKLSMYCKGDYKKVATKKDTKSLVEIKQRMFRKEFLKTNRDERNKISQDIYKTQEEDAIVNKKKLHKL